MIRMRALATAGRHALRHWRSKARVVVSTLIILSLLVFAGPAIAPPPPLPIPIGYSDPMPGCSNCRCSAAAHASLRTVILIEHIATRTHITLEFELHRYLFVIDRFFRLHILAAMMLMTQQASAVAMQQMQIIGAFFDAKEQLERQRLFDRLKAEAHRDYHPSMDMCVFGTNARSLAATQRRGVLAGHVLSQHFLDRQLNSAGVSAAEGPFQEGRDRMRKFYMRYCDIRDNNRRLEELCNTPGYISATQNRRSNRDIDYTRMIHARSSSSTDFAAPSWIVGQEERQDIFALGVNLYNSDLFDPASEAELTLLVNRPTYLDIRAIAAKRSVAFNSYAAIAGQRSFGSAMTASNAREYMGVVLRQLGLEPGTQEIQYYVGTRPSYNTQMEFLTKKLYQRPEYYTNLYDTEANVARKQASMRAIGLMQNFDMFKSRIRNEAMLAVLLELELKREQDAIVDRSAEIAREGRRE